MDRKLNCRVSAGFAALNAERPRLLAGVAERERAQRLFAGYGGEAFVAEGPPVVEYRILFNSHISEEIQAHESH